MSLATVGGLLVAPAAFAQPQSSAQAKCLTGLAKRAAKLVKVQGKEIDRCVYDLACAGGGNAFACKTADSKGKIAKTAQKLINTEAKRCSDLPDFGFVGAAEMVTAATAQRIALVEWSTTIGNLPASQAKCGRLYLRNLAKFLRLKLRSFGSCLKDGLADSSIQSAADIVGCSSRLDASSDPKLAKILDSIAAKMAKNRCGLFCFFFSTTEECAEQATSCRACEMLRIAGGLTVDCDLLRYALWNILHVL